MSAAAKSGMPGRGLSGRSRSSEQGYILLSMMLFMTLLLIAATAVAPHLVMQVKRDREEELIHRGVQYSRAIRNYVKKNGRYPTRLEDLENTNNIRYLRKRYKDPVTGKDFKLLHQGEVQLIGGGAGIAGAGAVGQNGLIQQIQGANGQISQAGVATQAGLSGLAGLTGQPGLGGGPATGLNGPSGPGTQDTSGTEDAAGPDKPPTTDSSNPSGSSTGLTGQAGQNGQNSDSPFSSNGPGGNNPNGNNGQVFGGGPILGVASASKEKSIRVFNKKDHYNDWQFIYDPSSDRGGLLTTPAQPPLQGATQNNAGQNGQPGQTGQPNGQLPGSGGNPTQPLAPSFPPDQQQPPQ